MDQLNFENSYTALSILKAVVFFFITLLGILFICLGTFKKSTQQLETRELSLEKIYKQEIFDVLYGRRCHFSPISSLEQILSFSKAFANFTEYNKSEAAQRYLLLEIVDKSAVLDLVDSYLSIDKWGVRYQVIDIYLNLHLPDTFERVLQHALTEDNIYVYSHCLYACCSLASDEKQIYQLIDSINLRNTYTTNFIENIFRILIRSLSDKNRSRVVFTSLCQSIYNQVLSTNLKIGIINAIGSEKQLHFKDTLVNYARQRADSAVSIAVMRAISNMDSFDSLILENLESPNPVVRVVAIRSCLHGDLTVLPTLATALKSFNFDVRFAAATTLIKIGVEGQRFLETAMLNKDRYIYNIAISKLRDET